MPFTKTEFPGLLIFEPLVHGDDRGYFFESYNAQTWLDGAELDVSFVQDNQARSVYGVVRGLHFQHEPFAQTKLIRALEGTILDVVVDIRSGSPTYGKAFSIELSAANKKQLLVPRGFAHGYSVLTETAEVFYKCDNFYNKSADGGIFFNDPALNIDWKIPGDRMILSAKDQQHPRLDAIKTAFVFTSQNADK